MTVLQHSSDDANDKYSWSLYTKRQQYKKRLPQKQASDKEKSKQYRLDLKARRELITQTDEETAAKREKNREYNKRYRDNLKKARQQNIEENARKAASSKKWRDKNKQKLLAKAGEDPASTEAGHNVPGDDVVAPDGLDEAQYHSLASANDEGPDPVQVLPDYDDTTAADYNLDYDDVAAADEPQRAADSADDTDTEDNNTFAERLQDLSTEAGHNVPGDDVVAPDGLDEAQYYSLASANDEGPDPVPVLPDYDDTTAADVDNNLDYDDLAAADEPQRAADSADDIDTEDNNTFAERLQDLSKTLSTTFGIFRSKTTTTRSAVRSVCVLL